MSVSIDSSQWDHNVEDFVVSKGKFFGTFFILVIF